jgi:hypothetical protein
MKSTDDYKVLISVSQKGVTYYAVNKTTEK